MLLTCAVEKAVALVVIRNNGGTGRIANRLATIGDEDGRTGGTDAPNPYYTTPIETIPPTDG